LTAPIFDSIEEQTRKNMALFEQALAMFNPFGNPLQTASGKPASKPADELSEELAGQNSHSDIEKMKRQLDQLWKRIETLASKE
jgi:polyhydroxyalkanoate synthesis regulator protein